MSPTTERYDSNSDEASRRKTRSLYIVRHFCGKLSLGVAFWINYVGGLFIFALGSKLLVSALGGFSLITSSYLYLSFSLLIAIAIPWLMIGVWRSASKHVALGGRRLWGLLAKVIILASLYDVGRLIIFQTIPMAGVYFGIITGDKDISPYGVIVHSEGAIIQFRGGLRAGAEQEFKKQLETSARIRVLQIESDGGRLKEGMRIGALIRKAGLVTVVSTHCKSAAIFLFIAGNERIVTRGAKIGFHRPSGIGSTDAEYENVQRFMEQAGIAKNFIDRTLSTSSDEMWYPTYDEMLQAGVVTGELVDGKIRR